MNKFQSQLLFADGECLKEKALRHYTRIEPLLAPRRVSVEDFERDMKQVKESPAPAHGAEEEK